MTRINSIDSELLDRMTEVELHLKYQSLSKALELLQLIIEIHPAYLPAKEALRDLYQKRGDTLKAQEIARQIAVLRESLAQKSIQEDLRPDAAEQVEKRRLTEKIDGILKEIYETQDLDGIQATAAARLVESLTADRCLIIRLRGNQEKAKGFEYCRKGISASFNSGTLELNRCIFRALSTTQKPLLFDDAAKNSILQEHQAVLEYFDIQSLLAFPLMYKSRLTGFVVIHRCKNPIQWSDQVQTIISTVTGHLAVAIHNAELFSEVQARAITDQLTGVYNRRFFEERMSAELSNAHQQKYPLCLALLDVDHFKSINDTYGHAVGDMVLHKLGFSAQDQFPERDRRSSIWR